MLIVVHLEYYMCDCPAGAETTLRDMLRPLKAAGHEIVVVLDREVGDNEPYEVEGIPVYPRKDKYVALHWIPRADLVITQLGGAVRGATLAKMWHKPVIQLVHSDRPYQRTYLSHGADLAVFNTEWVAGNYTEDDFAGRRLVIRPPVNPKDYKTSGRGKYVTLVNLIRSKGADIFYGLAERMPDVNFLAVKGGYGLQDVRDLPNVTHMDSTADMRDVYSKTRLLLMPSEYESYGRCAVEAAASGIPSVVSSAPGFVEALGSAAFSLAFDSPIEAWEGLVRSALEDKHTARSLARARSAELAEQAEREMAMWLDAVHLLAAGG